MDLIVEAVVSTKTFFNLFENVTCPSNNNEFIDPLSIIVMLAILKYKPIGTKLHIQYNNLQVNDQSIFQGIQRYFSRDTKTDLKKIHLPLIHACKFYLNKEPSTEDLTHLFVCAIKGIDNLKQTYKNFDEICNVLTMYENIIDKSLTNYNEIMNFLDNLIDLSEPKTTTENSKIKRMNVIKNEIYLQLNTIWSKERLSLIHNMFLELDKKQDSDRQNLFKLIFSLLNDCESDSKMLLKSFSNL